MGKGNRSKECHRSKRNGRRKRETSYTSVAGRKLFLGERGLQTKTPSFWCEKERKKKGLHGCRQGTTNQNLPATEAPTFLFTVSDDQRTEEKPPVMKRNSQSKQTHQKAPLRAKTTEWWHKNRGKLQLVNTGASQGCIIHHAHDSPSSTGKTKKTGQSLYERPLGVSS